MDHTASTLHFRHINISSKNWVSVTRSFPKLDCTIYKTCILLGAGNMAWAGEKKRRTSCLAKKERTVSAHSRCTFCHTCLHLWHAEDRAASWHVLVIKANKMHSFWNWFDKAFYMLWTGPLSIIRSSIWTLYTRNTWQFCWCLLVWSWQR
jgi:hypothetical protein